MKSVFWLGISRYNCR